MDSPNTPPGWYDDGHGTQRWWDGSAWTEHTGGSAPTPVAGGTTTYAQQATLVPVKSSKVWWIVPIALLVAGLIGFGLARATWNVADPAPLKQVFADYRAAAEARDCAALEAVTTVDFRDDLVVEPFDCAAWSASNPVVSDGPVLFGLRFGPEGVLVVDESRATGTTATTEVITYTFVREGGAWKIDDREAN